MTPTQGRPPNQTKGWLDATIARADALWNAGEHFVRRQLVWNRVYRATSYLRSALWTVPLLSIVLVLVIAPVMRGLDDWLGWRLTGLGKAGATSLYQTVITLTLSFLVFTFGSLLVAIQVASGQLTPRVIATTLLRNAVVKYTVGLFVFTLVLAVIALNRVETSAFGLATFFVGTLGTLCVITFLFLIDYAARLLRPVSILATVGDEGLAVINSVYPEPASDAPDVPTTFPPLADAGRRVVRYSGHPASILAVDLATLVREARWVDGVIELVPQVGDFLANGEPLFVLHGGAVRLGDDKLETTVAFGLERTLEQDPVFAFRIMADIALKALSPAINDPTTGVLAIDQLQRLLRVVGKRQLRGEAVLDDSGARRVIFRTPNWEDFVHVSCNEIRACGANNLQIARRLRAMLLNLIAVLPAHRHPPLQAELRWLDMAIEQAYNIPGDLELARIPDSQGLGGSRGAPPATESSESRQLLE